jgi:putative adenylate-forming enzyme
MRLAGGLRDFATLRRNRATLRGPALAAYQKRQMADLVGFAVRNSPLYREIYAGADLTATGLLPTIDKRLMMERFDDLNTAGLHRADLTAFALEMERTHDFLRTFEGGFVVGLSSGTSGNKGIYVTPRSLTRRLPWVFAARSGLGLRELPLRIGFMLRVFNQGFADIDSPPIRLSYVDTMRPAPDIVRRLRELDANVVMGPPSVLRLLIRQPEVADGSFHGRVKRIFSYAEVLDPHDRTAIAEAFGAPVVEIYQASEGLIACPCSHGSLHVNEDLVVLEALDAEGRPVTEPGVTCERTIITNLYNRVQPLIRYELNDLVAFGEPCPCGSGFRTIDRVVGRRDDVLEFETAGGGSRPVFPDLVSRWIITATDDLND